MASDDRATATASASPLITTTSSAAAPAVPASASASAFAAASDPAPTLTSAVPQPRPRTSSPEPLTADSGPRPLSFNNNNNNNNKRPREESPNSPTSPISSHFSREYSPTKVARLGLTAQLSTPLQLTGVAAIEEERRRREEEERRNPPGVSENPTHRALSDLMSSGTMTVSRPQDAPATMDEIALAAEATKALGPVTIPQPNVSDARTDISPPHSASSATGPADGHVVMNSPGPMDLDPRDDRQSYTSQPEAQMADKTATSLSYPGMLSSGSAQQASAPPPRHSSFSHNGEHTPSTSTFKKHKCPYCDTEFTRHHNLKSHLLTHSQEKPYLCQECKLRFRRLHDLKRHGKLHTGEKNHECPKCGRKFARGDALARHSKGSGGCAGRRASMGSYGDQGEYDGASRNEGDDSVMSGVGYDGNGDVDMTEEDRRRLSLPAIKAHHSAGPAETVGPTSRTYPPAVVARPGAPAVLYPPNVERSSNASAPSSSLANSIAGRSSPNPSRDPPFCFLDAPVLCNKTGSSSLSTEGITESPKPLSPAVHDPSRQRSPGLAGQYQPPPPHYTRRPSDRDIHPLPPLPPPHGTKHPYVYNVVRRQQGANPPPANAPVHPRPAANSGDGSSNLFAQGDQTAWTYMQQLEDRLKDHDERFAILETALRQRDTKILDQDAKIADLEHELDSLRKGLGDSRLRNEGPPPAT